MARKTSVPKLPVASPLSTKQLFNLTICAFGIQFGSALQMANMSSIYAFLGAHPDKLAYLWLAAPITGLIGQPIIGYLSDHTKGRFGRRRPYMFFWAIMAIITLYLMPNVTALWMAASLLWVLDFSNNGAAQPFRALIADITPRKQRVLAFALQTAFSGAGATIAAASPWLIERFLRVSPDATTAGGIPISIQLAFYIGGAAFFLATLWTVMTTKEIPLKRFTTLTRPRPQNLRCIILNAFSKGILELWYDLKNIPLMIRKFYSIQFFTWVGMFCMWLYFGIAVSQNVFGLPVGASIPGHKQYILMLDRGTVWTGICFATYQFSSVLWAFALPKLSNTIGFKMTHGVCLLLGAIGLISVEFIHTPYLLIPCMLGVGATWGSIMTMPYTIISMGIPKHQLGVFMGIFNITITVPQIICAFFLGIIAKDIFHNNAVGLILFGGSSLLIAGLITVYQSIFNPDNIRESLKASPT